MNFLRTSLLVASDPVLDEKVNSAMDEETPYSSLITLIKEGRQRQVKRLESGGVVASLDRQAKHQRPRTVCRIDKTKMERPT